MSRTFPVAERLAELEEFYSYDYVRVIERDHQVHVVELSIPELEAMIEAVKILAELREMSDAEEWRYAGVDICQCGNVNLRQCISKAEKRATAR